MDLQTFFEFTIRKSFAKIKLEQMFGKEQIMFEKLLEQLSEEQLAELMALAIELSKSEHTQ